MSVNVPVGDTVVKRITSDPTQVKRVVVGRPIRRVQEASGTSINGILGLDPSGAVTGSILVYNESTENFEATLQLEEQNVNGGQY